MTQSIQPSGNEPLKGSPMTLQELKKMNPASIFQMFDTNQSGTISDNEIREQGYLKELFDSVKTYLTQILGEQFVQNFTDDDGYFVYYDDTELNLLYLRKTMKIYQWAVTIISEMPEDMI